MRYALAAIFISGFILPAAAAEGDAITISIKRVRPFSTSSAEVLYEVTNGSGRSLAAIELSCSVKSKAGELIGVSPSFVNNVKAGETAAGKDFVDVTRENLANIGGASCRLISTR